MNPSLVIYRMPDTLGERHALACHVLAVNGIFIKETHTVGESVPADLLAMASNLSHALMLPLELRDTRPKPGTRINVAGLRLVV